MGLLCCDSDWGKDVQHDAAISASSKADNGSNTLSEDQPSSSIDLDRTRQQLGLSDDFIFTLLVDFNEKYETFEETLRGLLQQDDYKEARIYVHTLAGLTSTLAADEHHERARRLEASLAVSDVDIDISAIVESHNRLRSHISAITGR